MRMGILLEFLNDDALHLRRIDKWQRTIMLD